MTNKKGFTLIELLATIIILGIVAMIAYPVYSNTVDEGKDDLFRDNVKNLVTAIRTVNVVEFDETSGCIVDVEIKGTSLVGSWELVDDTIILHNVSDGIRTISLISEDELSSNFEVLREGTEDTCHSE